MPEVDAEEAFEQARRNRDVAFGYAYEQALARGRSINVYHKDGSYMWGVDSECLAVMAKGWLYVCQIAP